MNTPAIVTPAEWEAARQQLLVKEKGLTRARDVMAADRGRMPSVAVETPYEFDGPAAECISPTCARAAVSSSSTAPSSSPAYTAGPTMPSGSAPVYLHAVTDAAVVSTRPGVLTQLARRDPRVGTWMAEELAARVNDLLDELAMNAFWPVRRRLGRHLLDLAVNEQKEQVLIVHASHQELAYAVGSVREVVARTLASFRASGHVATHTGGIHLLDPFALAHLPN
jgi:hypothetical protein